MNPYDLFEDEAQQVPAKGASPAPTGPVDPYSLFEEETPTQPTAQPAATPTAAPEASEEGFSVASFLGNALSRPIRGAAALGEAGVGIAGGMAGEAIGGLAGLASLPFAGAEGGADVSQKVSSNVAGLFAPRSEQGKATMGVVGEAMAPVGDVLTATSETLGDTAFEVTGSPLVATAFYTLPDVALEVAGAGLGVKAGRSARAAEASRAADTASDIFRNNPTAMVDEALGAEWTVSKAGNVVENVQGKKLTKEGFSSTDAAMITNSNKATRTQMDAMTQAFDDMINDRKASRSGATARNPQYFVGQNIVVALDDANKVRKQLGKRIDEVVKGDLGKTRVAPDEALDAFFQGLKERGVKVKSADQAVGGVKVELDFRGSDLDFSTMAGSQRILQDAFSMVMEGGDTLADVHKTKRQLDNLLDAGKMSDSGVVGDVERFLGELRSGLNNTLSQVDEYRVVNDDYRLMADSMSYFDGFKPAGVSWDSPKVRQALSKSIPDAFADSSTGQAMIENLSRINGEMVRHGSPFKTDVAALSRYSDHLYEDWGKTVMANKGGIGNRQFRNNLQGAAISGAVGNKFGVANNIAGLVANGMDARSIASVKREVARKRALVNEALRK